MLGARCPDSVNDSWFTIVEAIDGHGLAGYVESLSALRA
jgi:hypothetical protein